MDELTNRSRTFAETVVTIVWLVLLGAALKGKSGVTGLDIPEYTLVLAGSTVITGVCPLLACCIFTNQRAVSEVAALLSTAMLLSLACCIATLTVTDEIVLAVAGLSLSCTVLRIISYCRQEENNEPGHEARTKEFHAILDGSHEFLCCTTGIHFLWLGSLSLDGQFSKSHGIQNDLSEAMGTVNIIVCGIGLCTMLIQMAPPLKYSTMVEIAGRLFGFDTFMIFSIGTVLGAAMWKSMVFPGLLLLIVGSVVIIGPLIAVFVLVLHVSCPEEAGGGDQGNNETPKLAPLGLTKLMVTGFLTISISVNSPDASITNWFLVFAAAAILSGLTWRLLTQAQVWKILENNKFVPVSQERIDKTAALASSAKTACFCANTFVAIATILLMVEIFIVKQSTSVAALAPAPAST
uniref:Uncharacterized protein n=1 Tax=Avena sativa TaxID=4498 RepID=A0ACD5ZEF4_AVESA